MTLEGQSGVIPVAAGRMMPSRIMGTAGMRRDHRRRTSPMIATIRAVGMTRVTATIHVTVGTRLIPPQKEPGTGRPAERPGAEAVADGKLWTVRNIRRSNLRTVPVCLATPRAVSGKHQSNLRAGDAG